MGCRLLLIALFFSLFATGCKPCDRLINGQCYDKPNRALPGLTGRWEMIDLETGKPIPDVWIGFYWRSFDDNKSRGTCARDVIGRTDANGQFSNTAKDGSWIFGETHYYKPGYYPVRYELFLDQTHITDFHALLGTPLGTYAAWEERLKKMGYVIGPERSLAFRKDFELGKEYQRIFDDVWSPRGLRMYWLKRREIPQYFEFLTINKHCPDRYKSPDRPVEAVGYDDPKNAREYIEKWHGWDAYQMFCDDGWDAVPIGTNTGHEAGFAIQALLLTGELDFAKREVLYAKYFDPKTLQPNAHERIQPEQRRKFCAELKQYTQIGVSK
jgi:hypothetical protein